MKVPVPAKAALDFPNPRPLPFGLANIISFQEWDIRETYGLQEYHFLATGGARLFQMPELQPFSVSVRNAGFGGSWNLRGQGINTEVYHEICVGFGYGRTFLNQLSVTAEAEIVQVSIDDYGTARTILFNIRSQYRIQPDASLGFLWSNVNRATLGQAGYPLAQRIALGGFYQPAPKLRCFVELEKDTRYAMQSRFGVILSIHKHLDILCGFQNNPKIISTGCSISIKSFYVNAAYQYHPELGISQCYGISVAF
jgi:hypothetical protein